MCVNEVCPDHFTEDCRTAYKTILILSGVFTNEWINSDPKFRHILRRKGRLSFFFSVSFEVGSPGFWTLALCVLGK